MKKTVRVLLSLVAMTVAMAFAMGGSAVWADTRTDGAGHTIREDIVAPSGGGQIAATSGMTIRASLGQVAVGLSRTTHGARCYHGVHAPAMDDGQLLSPNAVKCWALFE